MLNCAVVPIDLSGLRNPLSLTPLECAALADAQSVGCGAFLFLLPILYRASGYKRNEYSNTVLVAQMLLTPNISQKVILGVNS